MLSLSKLAKKKGYELVAALEISAFFVKKEYFELFKIKDNSPFSIRKKHDYETKLFQLYDGTLVLTGNKLLLWHGLEINQKRIQVLPKFLRKYPDQMNPLEKRLVGFLRHKRQGLFHSIFEKVVGFLKYCFASVKGNIKNK